MPMPDGMIRGKYEKSRVEPCLLGLIKN